jgi:hypothetical protein
MEERNPDKKSKKYIPPHQRHKQSNPPSPQTRNKPSKWKATRYNSTMNLDKRGTSHEHPSMKVFRSKNEYLLWDYRDDETWSTISNISRRTTNTGFTSGTVKPNPSKHAKERQTDRGIRGELSISEHINR